MTYEARQRFQEKREQAEALREQLARGDEDRPLTCAQGLDLLGLIDFVLQTASPERWDQALEVVAEEAARRADALASRRQ
ncbi:MAG: hypothetical protein ABFS14_01520 [Gemmatimonadota bacterium]